MKKKIKEKNKNRVFGARVPEPLQEAVRKYCDREKILLEGFFESALIRELEARRNGKK